MTMKEKIGMIKNMDMVAYLGSLGHSPAKIRGSEYWYLCPFRGEKTASFKINKELNRWYHFGIGKGGSLIDFGIAYFNCSVSAFISRFEDLKEHQPVTLAAAAAGANHQVKVTGVKDLDYYALLGYLKERGISSATAKKYCKQVNFEIGDKKMFAIGFPNDIGGYELRAKFIKLAAEPKGITFFKQGHSEVAVFEGFVDFLSFIEFNQGNAFPPCDYLILNSTSFVEKVIPLLKDYSQGHLFLDHDAAGRKCTEMVRRQLPHFCDQSALYQGYADLNEWHSRHLQKQQIRQASKLKP